MTDLVSDESGGLKQYLPEGGDMERSWLITDFEMGPAVGKGRFGSVYLCVEKKSRKPVALKILFKEQLEEYGVVHQLRHEIEIHARIVHPNVVRCYGYFQDEHRVYVVLAFAQGGDFHHFLRQQPDRRLPDLCAAFYIRQLVEALDFLHRNNVIHRDLKPENLLLDSNGNLLLADFGWSISCKEAKRYTLCGTIEYVAPEMLRNEPYGSSVDLWTVGVLAYEALVGRTPFAVPQGVSEVDMDCGHLDPAHLHFPDYVSPLAQNFIAKMLVTDQTSRPTLCEALSHEWLASTRDVTDVARLVTFPAGMTYEEAQGPSAGAGTQGSGAQGREGQQGKAGARRRRLPGQEGRTWTATDFIFGKPVGKGRYGSVYRCRERSSQRDLALKILFKEQLKDDGVMHQIRNEVEIHTQISHPHIVKCHGYFTDEHRLFLVMDLAAGELYRKLKAQPQGRFSETVAAKYIRQLIGALIFLHENHYIHRDLKPENLLLSEGDDLLLADFGWSISATQGRLRHTLCGTPDYIAPEMIRQEPGGYAESVDIWTVGVLCYEFLVGRTPFRALPEARAAAAARQAAQPEAVSEFARLPGNDGALYESILAGVVSYFPGHVSEAARDFIGQLLVVDPQKRLRLKDALHHPWMLHNTNEADTQPHDAQEPAQHN